MALQTHACDQNIHYHKPELQQHRHHGSLALALYHALLSGQGLGATGDWQLLTEYTMRQRYCTMRQRYSDRGAVPLSHDVSGHLGNCCYLLADQRMICSDSNCCNTFERRCGHVSGNVVPQVMADRRNQHFGADRECHAAARDGGQELEGPGGRSG